MGAARDLVSPPQPPRCHYPRASHKPFVACSRNWPRNCAGTRVSALTRARTHMRTPPAHALPQAHKRPRHSQLPLVTTPIVTPRLPLERARSLGRRRHRRRPGRRRTRPGGESALPTTSPHSTVPTTSRCDPSPSTTSQPPPSLAAPRTRRPRRTSILLCCYSTIILNSTLKYCDSIFL